MSEEKIRRETINNIYKETAENDPVGYLHYTEEQNVSEDIVGTPKAAAIIEGHETHTRTAEVTLDLEKICEFQEGIIPKKDGSLVRVAITQAVIYGWYDNEMGGYVNILGDRAVTMAENM